MSNINLLGPTPELLPLPTAFDDPLIEQLLRHWQEIRKPGEIPRRGDLDPTAMPLCLPHVWLYGYLADEDDFICRLAGAEVNAAWGFSIMGKKTSTLFKPDNHQTLKHRWKYILQTPAIMHSKLTTLIETNAFKRAERLTLPLADAQGKPSFILGITHYRFDRVQDEHKDVAPPEEKPIYYAID